MVYLILHQAPVYRFRRNIVTAIAQLSRRKAGQARQQPIEHLRNAQRFIMIRMHAAAPPLSVESDQDFNAGYGRHLRNNLRSLLRSARRLGVALLPSVILLASGFQSAHAAPPSAWSSSECAALGKPCNPATGKKFYPGFYALYGTDGAGVDSVDISDIAGKNQYVGIVRVYRWKNLEPAFGNYDFSQIERDKAIAKASGRKLGIYLRTDNISPGYSPSTPSYMWNDPTYGGVIDNYHGNYLGAYSNDIWAAMLWNPKVKARVYSLLDALAIKYNADADIAFVIFIEETTHGANKADDPNWTCSSEMQALKDIFTHAWSVLPNTPTLIELDSACADVPSNFHQFVVDGGHGAWTIDTQIDTQSVNPGSDSTFSLFRNHYNQIAGLNVLDGWSDVNKWPYYQTAAEILAHLGPGKILQPRYFVVDHSGSPDQASVNQAVDNWWAQNGRVWPLSQRPSGW